MKKSDYSFGEKLLHYLALWAPFIRKMSFEIDTIFSKNEEDVLNDRHIFISGLARSGTTILMRTIFESGQFRSITYRDMPFVLMPGLWKKFSHSFQKHKDAKERAHSDGIYVNLDSPEAFEEVFWQTFCGDDYIIDGCLHPHIVNDDVIEQFRSYVWRILSIADNSGKYRYLSKNNNNILRLGSIQKSFPNSMIIIPFRDPVQQAISLLNQHRRFCSKNSVDKFSCHYMRWLGHHEFGMSHKPFKFDHEKHAISVCYDTGDINYWLKIWISVNSYLLANAPPDSFFICFEDLCELPSRTLRHIMASAEILLEGERLNETFKTPQIKQAKHVNETILNTAQEIYTALKRLIQ